MPFRTPLVQIKPKIRRHGRRARFSFKTLFEVARHQTLPRKLEELKNLPDSLVLDRLELLLKDIRPNTHASSKFYPRHWKQFLGPLLYTEARDHALELIKAVTKGYTTTFCQVPPRNPVPTNSHRNPQEQVRLVSSLIKHQQLRHLCGPLPITKRFLFNKPIYIHPPHTVSKAPELIVSNGKIIESPIKNSEPRTVVNLSKVQSGLTGEKSAKSSKIISFMGPNGWRSWQTFCKGLEGIKMKEKQLPAVSFNACISYPPFRYPTIEEFVESLPRYSFIWCLDLRKGYHNLRRIMDQMHLAGYVAGNHL